MPDKRKTTDKSSGKSGKDKPAKEKNAQDQAGKQPGEEGAVPEQKVGDTPTLPWDMPSPEQKAEAKPVRSALRNALSEVDSPEKADAIVDELKAATMGLNVGDVAAVQPTPDSTAQAAKQVKEAEKTAPPGESAQAVLAQTAAVITTAKKPEREAVSQAAQEVFNAQQQGTDTAVASEPQDLLPRQC